MESEYELYFAFVSEQCPERVRRETLQDLVSIIMGSAICDAEEMECCRNSSVLLKGCHDHKVAPWREAGSQRIKGHVTCVDARELR